MLQIGQRPLLSERTTPSTHWLPCGGCLENPAASGEEQHHEEIARYICTKICLLEEKAERLSLAGYGVNPVGRPGAPNKQTNKQASLLAVKNCSLICIKLAIINSFLCFHASVYFKQEIYIASNNMSGLYDGDEYAVVWK